MFNRLLPRHLSWIVFGLTSIATACSDDSDSTNESAITGDGGTNDAGMGSSGKSGSAGKGANGGKGGAAGSSQGGAGGKAGNGGSGGSTTTTTMPPAMECTEDPPSEPFKCGDETCTVPEFANNPCVVPCCVEVDGKPACGAKSTSEMFPAACSVPAVADPACPPVSGGMGGEMAGCCNYEQGKCGIISTARPGCITQSTFVEIPDKTCSKPATEPTTNPPTDADAGMETETEPDAG